MDIRPRARICFDGCQNERAHVSNAHVTSLVDCLTAADLNARPADDRGSRDESAGHTDLAEVLLGHQALVRRLVHRLLGWRCRQGDLDDLVQEVMLAAWRHKAGFRGESSVATWLTRIAMRKVANHARWRRVRRILGPLAQPESVVDRHSATGGAGGTGGAGDGAAASENDCTAMRSAMAMLRHLDREVLVLHYLEQRSVVECAELLGCSRAAADQRLSRARSRLRQQLGLAKERM